MQKRILKYSEDLRTDLLSGVNKLAEAVKITMGPRGQNVLIEIPSSSPILTKDGVTVAEAINLVDKFENLGAQVVKEAARQTAEEAGDGTTSATVLAQAIFQLGAKYLSSGGNIRELRESISLAKEEAIDFLRKMSSEISNDTQLENVATISANGESEVGALIAEAVSKVGEHGYVSVENSRGYKTELVVVDGYQIDRGYISPYFINNQEKQSVEFKNPLILLTNQTISNLKDILFILEHSVKSNKPLIIIANDVTGDALQGLILNKSKGNLSCCVIRPPEFGLAREQALEDLAAVLGTEVIHHSTSEWKKTSILDNMGTCKTFKSYKEQSVFVDCDSDTKAQEERTNSIFSRMNQPNVSDEERNVLERRLRRLTSGVAVIYVGGSTESEVNERRDRVDDAVNATKVALSNGVIPGGGSSFLRASSHLKEKNSTGAAILSDALKKPLYQIAKNSGDVPELIIEKVSQSKKNFGYDASTGKITDLKKEGIIDPLKVAISALNNATSAALNLLSVGCAAVNSDKENNFE